MVEPQSGLMNEFVYGLGGFLIGVLAKSVLDMMARRDDVLSRLDSIEKRLDSID